MMRPALQRRLRRGFNLLEVIIASAILVMTITVIARVQYEAVVAAQRANELALGTQLAQEKLAEVQLLIETEGIGTADIAERGDFGNFGDDSRLDFRRALDDYRWEYYVEEIDMALSGDVMGMMAGMLGGDEGGEGAIGGGAGGAVDPDMQAQMMSQLGLGPDQLTEQMGQFVRRVRVRVYWGEEKDAEERGRQVVLTTHIISPTGAFQQAGGNPLDVGNN